LAATKAENHAVREAACACIAELGTKISRDVVQPYIRGMLDTLIECFQDESWPVRDGENETEALMICISNQFFTSSEFLFVSIAAACLACGNFVLAFPEESRSSVEQLLPLFFENLEDNIPSVRQG
jgi:hypothetical protein